LSCLLFWQVGAPEHWVQRWLDEPETAQWSGSAEAVLAGGACGAIERLNNRAAILSKDETTAHLHM